MKMAIIILQVLFSLDISISSFAHGGGKFKMAEDIVHKMKAKQNQLMYVRKGRCLPSNLLTYIFDYSLTFKINLTITIGIENINNSLNQRILL